MTFRYKKELAAVASKGFKTKAKRDSASNIKQRGAAKKLDRGDAVALVDVSYKAVKG